MSQRLLSILLSLLSLPVSVVVNFDVSMADRSRNMAAIAWDRSGIVDYKVERTGKSCRNRSPYSMCDCIIRFMQLSYSIKRLCYF